MAERVPGSATADDDATCGAAMPPPRSLRAAPRPRLPLDLARVAAPLVRQSDLPFRRLVRARGATLAVTQMYVAADLLREPAAMAAAVATCAADEGPVVVQLAGDDPGALLDAARALAPHVDGVDLNLGCPQERAREGHYGAYLAGPSRRDWPTVAACVAALATGLAPLPVSAKVRLQDDLASTRDFARLLAGAGVAWVAVHGRTRGSAAHRRAGPARLDWVRAVVDELRPAGVPVVTNGNVRCHGDVHGALAATGAAGVMSGEGLLEHPGLFACTSATAAAAAAAADARAGHGDDAAGARDGGACAVSACGCEWAGDHHVGPRRSSDSSGSSSAAPAPACCCRPSLASTVATIHAYLAEVEALPAGHAARPPPADVGQHVSWMLGRRGSGPSLHYARLLPVAAAAASASAGAPANLALARDGPALKAALFTAAAASEASGGSYDALRAVVDSLLPPPPPQG
jgi:tRNA-dihydrouridine synthase 1